MMQNELTFKEYKNFLADKNVTPIKQPEFYLKNNALISELFNMLPCAVYILNYSTNEYLFVSKSTEDILGYEAKDFMEKGNPFFTSLIHPNDFTVFSEDLFKQFITSCSSQKDSEITDLCFSFNYRIRRKSGDYIKVIQQFSIVEVTEENYPLIAVGYLTDISNFKKDDDVNFSVTRRKSRASLELITQKSFPNNELMLSSRELEILKSIVNGKKSKEIAQSLFISIHTVNAHRRNILNKTNSKTIVDLIKYSIHNGLV